MLKFRSSDKLIEFLDVFMYVQKMYTLKTKREIFVAEKSIADLEGLSSTQSQFIARRMIKVESRRGIPNQVQGDSPDILSLCQVFAEILGNGNSRRQFKICTF